MQHASTPQPDDDMKTTTRTHTALTGHVIEYESTPDLAAFLTRLEDMISDPKATEQTMIGVAYSRENPLLDHTMHPVRAMVTKEVFDNPAYLVMTDLLFRKRVVQDKLDVNKIAAGYSVSVAEAAEQLGMHPSAIRQAIDARRLASWMKGGKHWLDPDELAAFARTSNRRGPKAAEKGAANLLDIVLGHTAGASLRIRSAKPVEKIDRVEGNVVHGKLDDWKRIVVLTTAGKNKRAFVIEPGDEEREIKHAPFCVRGRFNIVEKANATAKADAFWNDVEVQ